MKYTQDHSSKRIRGRSNINQSFEDESESPFLVQAVLVLFLGVGLLLISLRILDVLPLHTDILLAGIGLLGAFLCVISVALLKCHVLNQRKKTLQHATTDPVLQDAPWDKEKYQTDTCVKFLKELSGTLVMTAIFAPATWWAFKYYTAIDTSKLPILFGIFLLIPVLVLFAFNLFCFAAWKSLFKLIAKSLRFGSSQVLFSDFPYLVESTSIKITWQTPKRAFKASAGTFTLRCIQIEKKRISSKKVKTRRFAQWQGAYTFTQEKRFASSQSIPLNFDIPKNLPKTNLRADLPAYWELAVNLQRSGLDFKETYLIPVY